MMIRLFAGLSSGPRFRGVLAALAVCGLVAAPALAQNNFNADCLPPLSSTYVGQFHARYADGSNVYDLSNPRHADFTNCTPPPGGGSTNDAFGSFVAASVSINGGPSQPFTGNGNTVVRVTFNSQLGLQRFFDTEMLQLDINSGGILVRESPSRPSLGRTSITDLGGGQYRIDSFFDIFTELSLDGGQTWLPSIDTNGNPYAGRMEIPGSVAVATSAWSRVKALYKQP